MQYLLLLWRDRDTPHELGEHADPIAAYRAYTASLKEAGAFVAGDALHPSTDGSTVRQRDGSVLRTDGPFAETKEQLAGYYLIDVASPEEAEAWAARCPAATAGGAVEVRQIWLY